MSRYQTPTEEQVEAFRFVMHWLVQQDPTMRPSFLKVSGAVAREMKKATDEGTTT